MSEGGGHLQGRPELTRYARVRRAGPLLFVAGISSRQADNSIKGARSDGTGVLLLDVRAQTEGALENLGRTLEAAGVAVEGYDHEVSKSIYFKDPDGNTVELYVDPSDVWKQRPEAVAQMTPLDLQ